MAKIKILHIIKSLGRGGAETLLPETLKLHDKEKYEFHYIYFLPWKNQMEEAIIKNGGKVINIPAANNYRLLMQFKKVAEYCQTYGIDLIHCHLPWSGFLGRIVHQKTGIPLVYTEHNIQEKYHFLTKFLNKTTFNFQTLALGVSEDVEASIRKNISPAIGVKTLKNGVDTEHFKRSLPDGKRIRKQYGIPEDALVIGNLAVFREQKCIPNWISAFEEITLENENVYGLLVGAGPMEDEVRRLIKEKDLGEKVKLPGLQTDTLAFYSAMDIFMMTSAFEGLPIALLEAMSAECAIVSTKAGGVVEVVRDGKDGLLCDVNSHKDLVRLTQGLVVNSEKREFLKAAARKRVQESFSLTQMVKELEVIYDSILKNADAPKPIKENYLRTGS